MKSTFQVRLHVTKTLLKLRWENQVRRCSDGSLGSQHRALVSLHSHSRCQPGETPSGDSSGEHNNLKDRESVNSSPSLWSLMHINHILLWALTSECGFAEMAEAVKDISDLIRISDELEWWRVRILGDKVWAGGSSWHLCTRRGESRPKSEYMYRIQNISQGPLWHLLWWRKQQLRVRLGGWGQCQVRTTECSSFSSTSARPKSPKPKTQ